MDQFLGSRPGLFRSWSFGSDGAREDPTRPGNQPDHLRCADICLTAWDMTKEQRYLDLCVSHVGQWTNAIVATEALPAYLSADELGRFMACAHRADTRRSGVSRTRTATSTARASSLLVSNVVELLLRLWRITGQNRFRHAAERLLDVLVLQLSDPDTGPAADAIRCYRRATGDGRYDARIAEAATKSRPFDFSELGIEPRPVRRRRNPLIGKRFDMPKWYEDGEPRRSNPVLLAVAAEIGNDKRLAIRSLDLGQAYVALARRVYPHGREHGCSARSVSAVARGHGRDNHVGVTTGVLGPILDVFRQA